MSTDLRPEISLESIGRAAESLRTVAFLTPLLESATLSQACDTHVALKAEHLQRTGAFKIRGAYWRMVNDTDKRDVVAASAGNHAQGVALAARTLNRKATIFMPTFASLQKSEATRSYGADVHHFGDTFEDSLGEANQFAEKHGALLLHPFDDPFVIEGQATIGLEILAQQPNVRAVVVPVGGGGLAAGIASAIKLTDSTIKVFGVRPSDMPNTIADGAAVKEPGSITGKILDSLLDDVVEVSDEQIASAILFSLERLKQVLEGAGAMALAALRSGTIKTAGDTVAITSGGNIDPGLLQRVLRHGLAVAGRYLSISLEIDDLPGRLQRVLTLIADQGVNVVSVAHHRSAPSLAVGSVYVEFTLEARNKQHGDQLIDHLSTAGYSVKST